MKKIVLGTVLVCMMGLSPVAAQESKTAKDSSHVHKHGQKHSHHPEKRMEMLKKELNLSDEQATKVKEAFVAHHQKMKAGKDLGEAERKSLHQTSKQELDTQLKGILSEKQYGKYQKKIAKRKKHKHKHRRCHCD